MKGGVAGVVIVATFAAAAGYIIYKRIRRPKDKQQANEEDNDEFDENDPNNKNLLSLLYSIAEEQSKRNSIHRGFRCSQCNMFPIRGIRYKCANCNEYDICEQCESMDNHNRAHVFYRIRVPLPPLSNTFGPCLEPFYPGGRGFSLSSVQIEKMRALQEETRFEAQEFDTIMDQFKSLSSVDTESGGIDRVSFDRCLPSSLSDNLIADRIFKFYDQDGDGIINFEEFVRGLSTLSRGTIDEKAKYAFLACDLDSDGFISPDEMVKIFEAYFTVTEIFVKGVVKSVEDELTENFEELSDRPVSATFHATIPQDQRTPLPNVKTDDLPSTDSHNKTFQESNDDVEFSLMAREMWRDSLTGLVVRLFEQVDSTKRGKLDMAEFISLAKSDSTAIQWFDCLGTVF